MHKAGYSITTTPHYMDSQVDIALIQSEALYCLRREQLVNLCKRRGIKARGKTSHLADLLRESLQAAHPVLPASQISHPTTSPNFSRPLVSREHSPTHESVPHMSRSYAMHPSSPMSRTSLERQSSLLSTRSRFSRFDPYADTNSVYSHTMTESIEMMMEARGGYSRCVSPKPSVVDTMPMPAVHEISNAKEEKHFCNGDVNGEEEVSGDALDTLISAYADDSGLSAHKHDASKAEESKSESEQELPTPPEHNSEVRPSTAMDLLPLPASPLAVLESRPASCFDHPMMAKSPASPKSTPPLYFDIPVERTPASASASSSANIDVPASLRPYSPLPRPASPLKTSQPEAKATPLSFSADFELLNVPIMNSPKTEIKTETESVSEIPKQKFTRMGKMARRMRSLLDTNAPQTDKGVAQPKAVSCVKPELRGMTMTDPYALRQALYSPSRMPTTTVPIVEAYDTGADENIPPSALMRGRSLRSTRTVKTTRKLPNTMHPWQQSKGSSIPAGSRALR